MSAYSTKAAKLRQKILGNQRNAMPWKRMEGFLTGQAGCRSGLPVPVFARGSLEEVMMRNSRDRNRVSNEPYEIEYIHRQFPNRSHEEVERAIRQAKSQMGGSEDRNRLMEILNRALK